MGTPLSLEGSTAGGPRPGRQDPRPPSLRSAVLGGPCAAQHALLCACWSRDAPAFGVDDREAMRIAEISRSANPGYSVPRTRLMRTRSSATAYDIPRPHDALPDGPAAGARRREYAYTHGLDQHPGSPLGYRRTCWSTSPAAAPEPRWHLWVTRSPPEPATYVVCPAGTSDLSPLHAGVTRQGRGRSDDDLWPSTRRRRIPAEDHWPVERLARACGGGAAQASGCRALAAALTTAPVARRVARRARPTTAGPRRAACRSGRSTRTGGSAPRGRRRSMPVR